MTIFSTLETSLAKNKFKICIICSCMKSKERDIKLWNLLWSWDRWDKHKHVLMMLYSWEEQKLACTYFWFLHNIILENQLLLQSSSPLLSCSLVNSFLSDIFQGYKRHLVVRITTSQTAIMATDAFACATRIASLYSLCLRSRAPLPRQLFVLNLQFTPWIFLLISIPMNFNNTTPESCLVRKSLHSIISLSLLLISSFDSLWARKVCPNYSFVTYPLE